MDVSVDPLTLVLSGSASVEIRNQGDLAAGAFDVTVFADRNGNGALDPGSDLILGASPVVGSLPGAPVEATVQLELADRREGGAEEDPVDPRRAEVRAERAQTPLDVLDSGATIALADGSHDAASRRRGAGPRPTRAGAGSPVAVAVPELRHVRLHEGAVALHAHQEPLDVELDDGVANVRIAEPVPSKDEGVGELQ